jgi:dGTP triphosphohydrolase
LKYIIHKILKENIKGSISNKLFKLTTILFPPHSVFEDWYTDATENGLVDVQIEYSIDPKTTFSENASIYDVKYSGTIFVLIHDIRTKSIVDDLEDALVSGQVKLHDLTNDFADIYKDAQSNNLADITIDEAKVALENLQKLSCWPKEYDGSHRALARLKDLASQLVGRFARAAEEATREQYGPGQLTRYNANLVVPRAQHVEVAFLKSLAGFYIINSERSVKRYDNEQTLIQELVAAVLKGAPKTLESFFLQDWQRATTDSARLRVVIDQVASLTDPGAIALAARLR